jgi:hypothetical protein
MIGFVEVAALITVVGAAIYALAGATRLGLANLQSMV